MRYAALAMAGVLAMAGPAAAFDYNDANDGNWKADDADTWGQGMNVYPSLATDTAVVDSNSVYWQGGLPAGLAVTLDGGTLSSGQPHFDHAMTIGNTDPAGSTIRNGSTWRRVELTAAAVLSGSGKLTLNGGTGTADMFVRSSSPAFSGETVIAGNTVALLADQALGTGNVTVDGATLSINSGQTTTPGLVEVMNGGRYSLYKTNSAWNVTLNSGTYATAGRLQVDGTVDLASGTDNTFVLSLSDGFVNKNAGTLAFSGSGNLTVTESGADLAHNGMVLRSASSMTGRLTVDVAILRLYSGTLGSGDITIKPRGAGANDHSMLDINVSGATDPAECLLYLEKNGTNYARLDLASGTLTEVYAAHVDGLGAVGGSWLAAGDYTSANLGNYITNQGTLRVHNDGPPGAALIPEPAGLSLAGLALLTLKRRRK